LVWLGVALMPACCVFNKAAVDPHYGKLTLVERLELQTVALVRFVDDNGNEVRPADIGGGDKKKASLVTYCTGVWVSHDTVLTAEHCVDGIGRPTPDESNATDELKKLLGIALPKSSWTPVGQAVMYSVRDDITVDHQGYREAKVTAVDMDNDLALFKAGDPGDHSFAHLSANRVHDGDELHLVGNTHGTWWSYIHGYVAAYRPKESDNHDRERPMLQVSAPIAGGDSGGGAFNAEGELVGVCDLVSSTMPNVGWYVPQVVVQAFLVHNRVIPIR
jgi:hypothetical protein